MARPLKELSLHQPSTTCKSSERAGKHEWLLSTAGLALCMSGAVVTTAGKSTVKQPCHSSNSAFHSSVLGSHALSTPFFHVVLQALSGYYRCSVYVWEPIVVYYLYFEQLQLSEVTTDHCKILQLFRSRSLKTSINLIVV